MSHVEPTLTQSSTSSTSLPGQPEAGSCAAIFLAPDRVTLSTQAIVCPQSEAPATFTGAPSAAGSCVAIILSPEDTTISEQQGVGCPQSANSATITGVPSAAGSLVTTTPAPTAPAGGVPEATQGAEANQNNLKDGLSGGAVAGVAVGCLIAGAAIAAIILLILFRRRRNKQTAGFVQHHLPYNGAHNGPEKAPIVTTNAVVNSIDNLIPQPVDDETITKEISRLRDNIKNHVRTYYRFDPVGAADIPHEHLASLATASGINTDILVGSLLNPAQRDTALRLFIAWAILSRCEGNKLPSLLPTGVDTLNVVVPNGRNSLTSNGKT